ncbi:MAG: hypothetical protein AAF682_10295 [Planctomycetota bacterium]
MPNVHVTDIYLDPAQAEQIEKEATQVDRANREQKRLYLAVRQILREQFRFDQNSAPLSPIPADPEQFHDYDQDDARAAFVVIYGQLIGPYRDPTLGREGSVGRGDILIQVPPTDAAAPSGGFPGEDASDSSGDGPPPGSFRAARRFIDAVVDAIKEFTSNKALYRSVHDTITKEAVDQADGVADPDFVPKIRARLVADVGKRLVEQGVNPLDPQLRRKILGALSLALGGELEGRASQIDIDLPDLDLDAGSSSDIVADNVLALSAVYFSAMLEEMRYFAVADRLAEQFMSGMLPISRGDGGQNVFQYIKGADDRFSEAERRGLYARAFGLAQGSVEVELPNRDFSDLWIRMLSAISLLNRQAKEEKMLVHPQQVHKIAHDLAVNLSLHGYAISHFFAVELQDLVHGVGGMLSHPEVLNAYGVRDQWQLVDRISRVFMGGPVNTLRYRTQAQSGAKIIKWLSENAAVLSSPFTSARGDMFREPALVDYVERWLAVTGTPDQAIEEFSEPVVTPTQSSLPTLSLAEMPDIQGAIDQVIDVEAPQVPTV